MRALLQTFIRSCGYELRKNKTIYGSMPAAADRPIGYTNLFLEDIKHRGFNLQFAIDIGAHQGGFTKLLLKAYPCANVLMVEPLDEMEAELNKLCKDYPAQLSYVKAGAGSKGGFISQTVGQDLMGATFLCDKNSQKCTSQSQRLTKVDTVNNFLKENFPSHNIPELVKIDVQGFELEVLKGADTLFGKTEMFILEVSLYQFESGQPLFDEIINFMKSKDYVAYDIVKVLRRPFDGALGQLDIVFVMQDSLLRRNNLWK